MSIKCKDGVFKAESGSWGYRFSIVVDGKRITRKKVTDENGERLTCRRAAVTARELAMQAARTEYLHKKPKRRRTVGEVYEEYCDKGRLDKAYATVKKQESLWKNHLCERFGGRFVDDISAGEVADYLAELYYVEGYSYQYTESFLKMFYLIFGQAYSRDYLDVEVYNKLCVNKSTKIRMPKLKSEDDTEIIAFSREQLLKLDEYFSGKNTETAYLLGRYCGLRINECFGLKWDNVDIAAGTITIDRQMQYQNGLIKLVAPKTLNSKRLLYMNAVLKEHFGRLWERRCADEVELAERREQNQRFIVDLDGRKISSTELVNCLPDGKLQTVNSMKYPTREIKQKLGIDFKYHFLRHTYGTLMAEMNTPAHLLCAQMGHGNIHVTQRYYLAVLKSGVELLRGNIDKL